MMTLEEIKERLCTYDKRSPYYYAPDDDEPREPRKDCYCYNCFYGRDKLAVELLRYKEGKDHV